MGDIACYFSYIFRIFGLWGFSGSVAGPQDRNSKSKIRVAPPTPTCCQAHLQRSCWHPPLEAQPWEPCAAQHLGAYPWWSFRPGSDLPSIQRKTKGQQLKGKIVSALFHTFGHFSTHFHTFSEFFRIFPPGFFLRIKGFYHCFSVSDIFFSGSGTEREEAPEEAARGGSVLTENAGRGGGLQGGGVEGGGGRRWGGVCGEGGGG